MNLNDLFHDLALGEVSNLAMSENGTIIAERRPNVVVAANEALLKLHSRFVLKEKDVMVEMREAHTNYHLLKRYAFSQYSDENPPDRWNMPYIMDTAGEPFLEDVIKVLSVYNSFGMKMGLNDTENPMSLHTPQSTLLQVPFPVAGHALVVEYQARHTLLDHCNCEEEIYIPDVLWPALKSYIAYKIYSNMGTPEATAKSQEHQMNYEAGCLEVVEKDLVSSSYSTTNTKFHKRGFV